MCPQSESNVYLHNVSSSFAGFSRVMTLLRSLHHRLAPASTMTSVPADAAAVMVGAGVSSIASATCKREAELLPTWCDHGVLAISPFGKGCWGAS